MRQVYADTSYRIALLNHTDHLHAAAVKKTKTLGGHVLVMSEAVLIELLNYASRTLEFRDLAARKVRVALEHPEMDIVPLSHEAFLDALGLYEARGDKEYSLTDCLSMKIMEERGITDVLTADQHFAQAGFTALLT